MEVILQQDYPSLGYIGDRVKVKRGYARNFLIPRGVALESSLRNEKVLKHHLGSISARKVRMRGEAQDAATKFESLRLEFFLRMGGAGKTFGSVTARDIEGALKKEGLVVDKRQIILAEPIKKAGEHKVSVKLHSEVVAQVTIQVNTDLPQQAPEITAEGEEGEAAKPERKSRTRRRAQEKGTDSKPDEGEENQKTKAEAEPKKGQGRKSAAKKTAAPVEDQQSAEKIEDQGRKARTAKSDAAAE